MLIARSRGLERVEAAKEASSRALSRSDWHIAYANAAPAAAPSRVPTKALPTLSCPIGSVCVRVIPDVGACDPFIDFEAVEARSSAVCALDFALKTLESIDWIVSVLLRATSSCQSRTRVFSDGAGVTSSCSTSQGSRSMNSIVLPSRSSTAALKQPQLLRLLGAPLGKPPAFNAAA